MRFLAAFLFESSSTAFLLMAAVCFPLWLLPRVFFPLAVFLLMAAVSVSLRLRLYHLQEAESRATPLMQRLGEMLRAGN